MEENLILEYYSKYKKMALMESPYRCLLDAHIERNPHQINAFCAAVQSIPTGGIVLADEVGLGKTIEACLVLKYMLDSGARRIMIVLPAALRKQWEIELEEKFGLESIILDRLTVESDYYSYKSLLEDRAKKRIIIASYDYSSKLMKRFPNVKWDFLIIDEAHNLRNVFNGTKRAKRLYEMSQGIPKVLLTATPLQNSLKDLHGLISFIDPRIFGDEKVFEHRFIEDQDYSRLKAELQPVLYRTLRRDVSKYMAFSKRECRTIDFSLSHEEGALYAKVNEFLKRDNLYSIPNNNNSLITLVIRKLLASSSFALAETFEVLKKRLEKLYEGTKSANAMEGFDLFWKYVEDEIDEEDFDPQDDEDTVFKKQQIQAELDEVDTIIKMALAIRDNAKLDALKTAISAAFEHQVEQGIPQKVLIFTESKRTQRYIVDQLREGGYSEDDILIFNGDFDDALSKKIFNAWRAKNFGKADYGRNVEYKHAIVDYFKEHARILVVTDAASEGLNLQFCSTVINYDLPWNPQKIEQRIGRCHRYGQTHDVVAINLLNTQNMADKRVYDILSKKFELFEGVFGASDVALGILESGTNFEKQILEIYQRCGSSDEFKKAFDKLDRQLDAKRDKKAQQLRELLLTESPEAKGAALDETKENIDRYLRQVAYWEQYETPDEPFETQYWRIDNWGDENIGGHGLLFVGAMTNAKGGKLLFPVLLLCDEKQEYIDFSEDDLVNALENARDEDVHYFKPTDKEMKMFQRVYNRLTKEMTAKYVASTAPIQEYNKHKVEAWSEVRKDQLNLSIDELRGEIADLQEQEAQAHEFLEKIDIRKKISEKQKQLQKIQDTYWGKVCTIENEAREEIKAFNEQFLIDPLLIVNIVLKF